jgi:hypothetical protein
LTLTPIWWREAKVFKRPLAWCFGPTEDLAESK